MLQIMYQLILGTVLEEYLCRSLAFTLLTLAIIAVLLTGTIPLSSSLSECKFEDISYLLGLILIHQFSGNHLGSG